MAAAAPNPNNMILLAVLGIGAYWIMSRRATAGTVRPAGTAAPQGNQLAAIVNGVSSLIGSLTGSRTTSNLNGTVDGRAATAWDTTPYGSSGPAYNNPSAYIAPSTDGAAVNPSPTVDWDQFWQNDTGDLGSYL